MAFCCKVQHRAGLVLLKYFAHGIAVGDVGMDQMGLAGVQLLLDGGRVAGIGELDRKSVV